MIRVLPHVLLGLVYRYAPLAAGAWLAGSHGVLPAIAMVAAFYALASAPAAWLLHGAPLGRVSWRNRAAVPLAPWLHVLGGGSLPGLLSASWCCVTLLAAAGALGRDCPWLLAAWLLDGWAGAYLMRVRVRSCHHRAQRRAVDAVLGGLVTLAMAGLVAALLGAPRVGAVLAAGPLLLVGGLYGLWLGSVLLARPRRWN